MNSSENHTPHAPPSSEILSQLVERAQQGSREAFERLLSETLPLTRRVAATVLPRDQIDDALQESYLLVFRKLPQLKETAAFKGWFSRIVLRVCYDIKRKSKFNESIPEHLEAKEKTDSIVNAIALRNALNRLPAQQRDLLVMREVLGLTYEELSFALRVPIGTVRSRLHKARGRLKQAWRVGESPSQHRPTDEERDRRRT